MDLSKRRKFKLVAQSALLLAMPLISAIFFIVGHNRIVHFCEHSIGVIGAKGGHCRLEFQVHSLKIEALGYQFIESGVGLGRISTKLNWPNAFRLILSPEIPSNSDTGWLLNASKLGFVEGELSLLAEDIRIPRKILGSGIETSAFNFAGNLSLLSDGMLNIRGTIHLENEPDIGSEVALELPLQIEFGDANSFPNVVLHSGRVFLSGEDILVNGRWWGGEYFAQKWSLSFGNVAIESLTSGGLLKNVPIELQKLSFDLEVSSERQIVELLLSRARGAVNLSRLNEFAASHLSGRIAETISRSKSRFGFNVGNVQTEVAHFIRSALPQEAVLEQGEAYLLVVGRPMASGMTFEPVRHRSSWGLRAVSREFGEVLFDIRHNTFEKSNLEIDWNGANLREGLPTESVRDGWLRIRSYAAEIVNFDLGVDLNPVLDGGQQPISLSLKDAEVERIFGRLVANGLSKLGELSGVILDRQNKVDTAKARESIQSLEQSGKSWLQGLIEKSEASDEKSRRESQERMLESEKAIKNAIRGLLSR